jgi:hypothetical protein
MGSEQDILSQVPISPLLGMWLSATFRQEDFERPGLLDKWLARGILAGIEILAATEPTDDCCL